MGLKEKFKKTTIPYMIAKLWQYSDGRRGNVIWYLLRFFISNLIDLLIPLVIIGLTQEYQNHGGIDRNNLWRVIGIISLYPLLKIFFWIFHGPARVSEVVNAFLMKVDFKKRMVDCVMSWSFQKHLEHKAGDTIIRIAKGGSSLENFGSSTYNLVTLVVRMIGAFIILSFLEVSSMLVVTITMLITILVIMRFDKKLIKQSRELLEEDNQISERISDNITNIRSIIIYRVERAISDSIGTKLISPLQLRQDYMIRNEWKWFSTAIGSALMASLTMILYIFLRVNNNPELTLDVINMGMIIALWTYLMRIGETLFTFAEQYASIVKYKIEVENCEDLEEHFNHSDYATSSKLPDNWQELEVRSLSFTHEVSGAGKFKLKSSGLVIGRGQKIALIGKSGSGKSTLLGTIRQLYQPEKAEIYLDGNRLERGFATINRDIALIHQDVEIFSTSIMKNITLEMEELEGLAEHFTDMACLTEVIKQLPDQFQSLTNDKGVNLSGGQRQRLALARAFLFARDKKIILVDEPTSNVDMISNEQEIFKNMFNEFKDKAIICALHGLHLLDLFDTVYLFDEGKVIASGTPDEIRACQQFKELTNKTDPNDDLFVAPIE